MDSQIDIPVESIFSVTFSPTSDKNNIIHSNVNVKSTDILRGTEPKKDGVFSQALGTTSHRYRCDTCYNSKTECLGHDGSIDLNSPIKQTLFISDLLKWLNVICFNCGKPIIDKSKYINVKPRDRLTAAEKVSKGPRTKSCIHCKFVHPKVSKRTDETFIFELSTDDENSPPVIIDNFKIYQILDKVSDATVEELGRSILAHPRNYIINVLKVPPVTIRPEVTRPGNQAGTNDSDVTAIYRFLVMRNESISPIKHNEMTADEFNATYTISALLHQLIKGPISKNKSKYGPSSKEYVSLAQTIKGKPGIMRSALLGKRTFNMGRSTIANDPYLKLDEVGVPLYFAITISIPEVVQEYNREEMMVYFNNGKMRYPGCTKVQKKSSKTIYDIDNIRNDFELEIGDTIYRNMIDGDIIFDNRQPSLLFSNITALRVFVIKNPDIFTIRMNVLICPFFNADFDGDAMNLISLASVKGRNEAQKLSHAKNWVISPKDSAPLLGEAEDSLVGSFELTRTGVKFNKFNAMMKFNNCFHMPNFTEKEYTGRDVMSLLLKKNPVNYRGKPKYYKKEFQNYINYNPDDIEVIIENGQLIKGVLDASSIKKGGRGNLIHTICTEYGPEETLKVMFDMQHLAINYLTNNFGYTIGIHDLLIDDETVKKMEEIGSTITTRAGLIIDKLRDGNIVPPIGKTVHQFVEELLINELRIMEDFNATIGAFNPTQNGLYKIILCGSKGSIANVFNITSSIGQKIINGKRINEKFSYKRTGPFFPRSSANPAAKGYIGNSYINGMNLWEFFCNAISARFDLTTKALTTSVTGHSNRKSIHCLVSIITDNRRSSVLNGRVVQFAYGDTNIDPRELINFKFKTVMMSDADFTAKYNYISGKTATATTAETEPTTFKDEFERIRQDREDYRNAYLKIEKTSNSAIMKDSQLLPFSVTYFINKLLSLPGGKRKSPPSEDELVRMVKKVKKFNEELPYVMLNENCKKNKTDIPHVFKFATWLSQMSIRQELCSNGALQHLTESALDEVLNLIYMKYSASLIQYGTPVGIFAAQCFSEPFSQTMLDAHHHSATGGTQTNILVKMKEILSAWEHSKLHSPSMTLYLKDEYSDSQEKAQNIANTIGMVQFKVFLKNTMDIFYEEFGKPVHPLFSNESEIIADYIKRNPLLVPPRDLTKWCIRYSIDRVKLIMKSMPLKTIIMRLNEEFPNMYIVHSPENSKEIIIRIYIRGVEFKSTSRSPLDVVKEIANMINSTIIRGIDGIRDARVFKVIESVVDESGAVVQKNNRYGIKTEGSNIFEAIKSGYFDPLTAQTDSIDETFQMFGIEAARRKIIGALGNFISVALNHLYIYADTMTVTGTVTSIEKPGMVEREPDNIFGQMGFASPMVALEKAGKYAITSKIEGFTSSLLMGKPPKYGTGYNRLAINEKFIRENTKKLDDYLDEI